MKTLHLEHLIIEKNLLLLLQIPLVFRQYYQPLILMPWVLGVMLKTEPTQHRILDLIFVQFFKSSSQSFKKFSAIQKLSKKHKGEIKEAWVSGFDTCVKQCEKEASSHTYFVCKLLKYYCTLYWHNIFYSRKFKWFTLHWRRRFDLRKGS